MFVSEKRIWFEIISHEQNNFKELSATILDEPLGNPADKSNNLTQWSDFQKIIYNFICSVPQILHCEVLSRPGRSKMYMAHDDNELYCVPPKFNLNSISCYSCETRPYINFCCSEDLFWNLMNKNTKLNIIGRLPYFKNPPKILPQGVRLAAQNSLLLIKGEIPLDENEIVLDQTKFFYKNSPWKIINGITIPIDEYNVDSPYIKSIRENENQSYCCEIYIIHSDFGCSNKEFERELNNLISGESILKN